MGPYIVIVDNDMIFIIFVGNLNNKYLMLNK